MTQSDDVTIRPARRDEADKLTQLGIRATLAYGYDAETIKRLEPVLAVDETLFASGRIFVAEGPERDAAAVMAVVPTPFLGLVLLDRIFVDPVQQRKGTGRHLFAEAITQAAQLNGSVMLIYAHPLATGFYERLGAVKIGETQLPILPALKMPMMAYSIHNAGQNR